MIIYTWCKYKHQGNCVQTSQLSFQKLTVHELLTYHIWYIKLHKNSTRPSSNLCPSYECTVYSLTST